MEFFWIVLGVIVAGVAILWIGKRFARRKLKAAVYKRIQKQFQHARSLDPARSIMEADSILDHALKELGYQGSLGEKLKKMGARFSNEDAVWKAHKLRNRIAHEPGVHISEQDADRALKVFEKAIGELL